VELPGKFGRWFDRLLDVLEAGSSKAYAGPNSRMVSDRGRAHSRCAILVRSAQPVHQSAWGRGEARARRQEVGVDLQAPGNALVALNSARRDDEASCGISAGLSCSPCRNRCAGPCRGGGELTGYYKKDSVVKIVEWIGLSYGNRTREFYFKENKLFFVYEKFESFVHNDKTNELDLTKVKTTFEGRYYFNNKKLIDQKNSGKRTFEENESGMEEELQTSAEENINLLNKKRTMSTNNDHEHQTSL